MSSAPPRTRRRWRTAASLMSCLTQRARSQIGAWAGWVVAGCRCWPPAHHVVSMCRLGRERALKVKAAMQHTWNGYETKAWGADELKPRSGRPQNNWGGMGMTLLDSLDVLWIMGMKEEFQRARDWVVDNLSFAKPRSVSFFETTIRALGGLLSAYELSKDKVFLDKAQDLGDRLLHAFKTPSGIPHGQVHLTSGRSSNPGWTGSVRYFLPGRDLVLATHVY